MSQEIYFGHHREHSLEYPGVYVDIQAGLLRAIMRKPAARGILAVRHRTCLHGWMPGCFRIYRELPVAPDSWSPGRMSPGRMSVGRMSAAACQYAGAA
jgi:hypothetical protein